MNHTQKGAIKPQFRAFSDKWLSAKAKQSELQNKRKSLLKLIQARQNRLFNLQTLIENEINDFRLRIYSVDEALEDLENTKDQCCQKMLSVLEGGDA